MCGLVGVAGRIYAQEKKAFRNLLELDQVRGPHSTGIAAVHNDNGVNLYKALGRAWHIYEEYPDAFDEDDFYRHYQVKALIGHNRFATVGKKIPENAHPFRHGGITGAHNGTLDKGYLHKIDGHDKFDVDSEALIYSFDKNGYKETLENTKGAWALTWFDEEHNRMCFIRNNDRPLYWAFTQDRQNLYWASEDWMLKTALAQAGVKHDVITMLDPFQLHYVEFDKDGAIKGRKLYYKPEEIRGYVPPVTKASVPTVNPYKGGQNNGSGPFPRTGQVPTTEAKNTTNSGETQQTVGKVSPPDYSQRTGSEAQDLIDNMTKNLIGTVISFQTFGERTPKLGLKHVLCDSSRVNNQYEIRIYSEHNPRHEEWAKSQQYFLGRIKSAVCNWDDVAGKWDRYVTLDMRTISAGQDDIPTVDQIKAANENPAKYEVIVITPKNKELPKSINETKIIDLFKKDKAESTVILGNSPLLKWDPAKEYKGYQGRILTFSQFMSAVKSGCSECGCEPTPYEVDELLWVGPKQFVCQLCDIRHRTEEALKRNARK